jgi:hypothetical protein
MISSLLRVELFSLQESATSQLKYAVCVQRDDRLVIYKMLLNIFVIV